MASARSAYADERPRRPPARPPLRDRPLRRATKVRGNRNPSSFDCQHVDCQPFRDALSARLDGELSALETTLLNAHLVSCVGCRAYDGRLEILHGRTRVRVAESVPDLTASILAKAHPPQPGRGEWVRWALLTVALTQLVVALPALALGDDAGATTHVARHLGSLTVAMAVGLAYVAWRPVRGRRVRSRCDRTRSWKFPGRGWSSRAAPCRRVFSIRRSARR